MGNRSQGLESHVSRISEDIRLLTHGELALLFSQVLVGVLRQVQNNEIYEA